MSLSLNYTVILSNLMHNQIEIETNRTKTNRIEANQLENVKKIVFRIFFQILMIRF